MTPQIYSFSLTVSEAHIDERKHVNNLVYLQWCLEAAEKHWNENTSEEIRQKYVWYVLNHNISYRAEALLGDNLIIQTWVASSEGVKSERHYKIVRDSDQKVLVEAQTLWCLLNAQTLRPTEVTSEISDLFISKQ